MNAEVFAQHICRGRLLPKCCTLKANEIATILAFFCCGGREKNTVVFNSFLHFTSSCDSLKWLTQPWTFPSSVQLTTTVIFPLVALHETALGQGAIVRIPERHDWDYSFVLYYPIIPFQRIKLAHQYSHLQLLTLQWYSLVCPYNKRMK